MEYNDKDCIISDDTELHLPNDLINIARSLKEAFNEEEVVGYVGDDDAGDV